MKTWEILLILTGLLVAGHADNYEVDMRDKRQIYSPLLVEPYGGTLKANGRSLREIQANLKNRKLLRRSNIADEQKANDIPKVKIWKEKWWYGGTGGWWMPRTSSLIVGIGIPIAIPGRSLAYGQNMQFQYPLPTNATFFSNLFSSDSSIRRRRSSSSYERPIAYSMLQHHFDRNGVDGKECIMRGICEAAETPLQEEGLVGELLHLLLTPDYGGDTSVDEEYMNAKTAGLRGEDCMELFPGCPEGHGILDHVSTIKYVK